MDSHLLGPDLAKSALVLADPVVIFAARRSRVSPAGAAAARVRQVARRLLPERWLNEEGTKLRYEPS